MKAKIKWFPKNQKTRVRQNDLYYMKYENELPVIYNMSVVIPIDNVVYINNLAALSENDFKLIESVGYRVETTMPQFPHLKLTEGCEYEKIKARIVDGQKEELKQSLNSLSSVQLMV